MMTDSTIANGVIAVIADASLKATVVLVAAGLWTLLDRSASAAMRHLVWLVALGSALVLPAIVPFAPAWRVSLPLPDRPSLDARFAGEPAVVTAVIPEAAEWRAIGDGIESGPSIVAVERADEALPPVAWVALQPPMERIAGDDITALFSADGGVTAAGLLLIWLAGLIAVATPRVRARLRLRRIEEAAAPVRSLWVRGEARGIAAELGIRRQVRLIEGPVGSMPMTWGVARPVVLLPPDAWRWSPARLRAVLRHEFAHVTRMDALAHAGAELACILHWFNPAVWFAANRLREESEHACDDRVLTHGGEPAEYASELVELARSLRPARAAALAGMAMARGRSLRGRLIAVLDDGRDRRPVSPLDALRAVTVALLAILPLACLAPSNAAPGPEPRVIQSPEAAFVWDPPAAAPHADGLPEPDALTWHPPPAPRPVQGRRPDPDLTVRVLRQAAGVLGDRELADLLELAAGSGGVSDEATRTAFLDAARTIGGDHDQARALEAWLATRPGEGDLIALVGVAAGIGSDRQAADVLVKAAGTRAVTPALSEAILRALDGIGSDRERRRVLESIAGEPVRR
jgi:beta-lactamase regulating signal transducer with metallopeptidase domain